MNKTQRLPRYTAVGMQQQQSSLLAGAQPVPPPPTVPTHTGAGPVQVPLNQQPRLNPELQRAAEQVQQFQPQVPSNTDPLAELAATRARLAAAESRLQQQQGSEQTILNQLAETNRRLEVMGQQAEAQRQATQQREYQIQLLQYRERVIATYKGEIIAEMVGGNTPEEINNSAQFAHQRWSEYRSQFSSPAAGQPSVPAAPQPQVQNPGSGFQVQQPAPPPMNPAYVPPPGAGGMFPQVTNPATPPAADASLMGFGDLTSEEAVRNGTYAQHREALRRAASQGNGGYQQGNSSWNVPRHMMPQAQLPNGVMQPNPGPMGPAGRPQQFNPMPQRPVNPQVPQGFQGQMPPQQWAPQVPQNQWQPPVGTPPGAMTDQQQYNAAMEAANRIHNGQVPPLQGQSAQGASVVQQAAQDIRGTTPQDAQNAFNQRFQHTPPINQQ